MSSLWTPGGERPVPRDEPAPEPLDDGSMIDEAELDARMAQLRDQLAHTPVEGIIAQVAYQLFEVAALHLSVQPPQLQQASLAIDGMGTLVEGLGERLGEHAAPLKDGLSQIRMAFVQIQKLPPTDPDVPGSPQS